LSLPPDLKDYLETAAYTLKLDDHPYFSGLLNGKISRKGFLDSQMQFAHLVQFFSRPMASMIANIPNAERRMVIVDNLWEEHGKGDKDKIHGRTILTLIDRLGGDSASVAKTAISPSIEIFNTALKGIATFDDYRVSAAVFSGIERTFVDVSSLICQAIIARGWLPADQITHYALHKELDIQHAEDFLAVVEEDWADAESKAMIKRGIRLGSELFARVYTDFAREFNY
jgi:pyrroloquinoline-quinone synthase